MRRKLYKIAAIFMAASMMSMTVFAAEGTSELTQSTDSDSNTDNYSDENNGSNDDSSGQETDGQTQDQTESQDTESDADAGSEDNTSDNAETEDADAGQKDETDSADTSGEESDTDTGSDSSNEENSAKPATESSDATASTGEADTSTDEESTEEETRRTASVESENWSNGEIKDVMGLKATTDGETVVISYKTKHTNDWDYSYSSYPITVTYPDGTTKTITITWNGEEIKGDGWTEIKGATLSKSSDQADTEILEISIPASWFESSEFTLSGGEYTTSVNGEEISDESSSNSDAVYSGITLDGNFGDWDAVTKYTLNEPDGESCVESVAWVIEDDYVYIYIKDDGSNSATWAGPNHNGKYAITTDLGRTLVFQLTEDGAVVGADGATSIHQGSQWEIAIPVSSLPQNNGGLSFGLYLSDTTLSGYGDTGTVGSVTDITYDGLYGDWDSYPHTEIEYATAGTHEEVPDGEAAIYFDNNIYGHCVTQMQAHLDEYGGEYTSAVTVAVNFDTSDSGAWDSSALQMRLVTVDSAGNINWNPQRTDLENGSYEYYIFDISAWGTSTNINNLVEADVCYGKATITISDTRQDMEWYVDATKLAEKYGIDATDIKTVSSQYGRIGQQWITTAGASSGPLGSAALCLLSAFVPFVTKKKFIFK